ncbi:MAG: hypothetical protein CMLOHMNK_02349 [Steroidobacteraceae bacterium]|nr:hypothetical protein [Steroidobacteraceae bacterium]
MSSTDSLPPDEAARAAGYRAGFDAAMRGRRADCEGGKAIEGTHFAGRQEFTGTLTGHYRDFGDYPWRWYLMTELTRKPGGYAHDAVWCESDSLVFEDDDRQGPCAS